MGAIGGGKAGCGSHESGEGVTLIGAGRSSPGSATQPGRGRHSGPRLLHPEGVRHATGGPAGGVVEAYATCFGCKLETPVREPLRTPAHRHGHTVEQCRDRVADQRLHRRERRLARVSGKHVGDGLADLRESARECTRVREMVRDQGELRVAGAYWNSVRTASAGLRCVRRAAGWGVAAMVNGGWWMADLGRVAEVAGRELLRRKLALAPAHRTRAWL